VISHEPSQSTSFHGGNTNASGLITIHGPSDVAPDLPPLTKDEERAAQYLDNKWEFESFLRWWCSGTVKGRDQTRSPCTHVMIRKYGTSNGLRPEPMLC